MKNKNVLWWGRSDKYYSRNMIIRNLFEELGWNIIDFHPYFSFSARVEVILKNFHGVDLVWVPCFRQRDLISASKWSKSRKIPLIFDPLISAYDKQVFERKKLERNSKKANRLLRWEKKIFQLPDIVIADTSEHLKYFSQQFDLNKNKISVIYVGADESIFHRVKRVRKNEKLDILFYGSFIPLQGPEVIVEAAFLCERQNLNVTWTLVGDGPLKSKCVALAKKLDIKTIRFVNWLNYHEELPSRIHQADVVLGVFGDTPKAGRVIPNKVFQSMAMGKPLVTQYSKAYPPKMQSSDCINWVKAGSPESLYNSIRELYGCPESLAKKSKASYQFYIDEFNRGIITHQLLVAIEKVMLMREMKY